MPVEKDQKFVEMVVKEIVDHPDDVKIERTVDERGVFLQLSINPEDMGKIIGKEGKTAKAIRTLLRIVGAKENARVNLKIVEPEGSEKPSKPLASEKPADAAEKISKAEGDAAADSKSEEKPIEEEKATEII